MLLGWLHFFLPLFPFQAVRPGKKEFPARGRGGGKKGRVGGSRFPHPAKRRKPILQSDCVRRKIEKSNCFQPK